jgi:hypothetical protein
VVDSSAQAELDPDMTVRALGELPLQGTPDSYFLSPALQQGFDKSFQGIGMGTDGEAMMMMLASTEAATAVGTSTDAGTGTDIGTSVGTGVGAGPIDISGPASSSSSGASVDTPSAGIASTGAGPDDPNPDPAQP